MKKVVTLFLILLVLTGCSDGVSDFPDNAEITKERWEFIEESAKDTILNVLYYSEDEEIIEWFEKDFSRHLRENYRISLRMTYMPLQEIKDLLEKQKEEEIAGDYDLIYISDDGFKFFKDHDLLYGPVLNKLPNYYFNLEGDMELTKMDEGTLIEAYEVPIFREQLVFIHHEDIIYETPKSFDELLTVAKENRSKVTYIHPENKTGLSFVLSAILSKVELETLNETPADKEKVYEVIKPGLEYLKTLDKYLYRKGEYYPKTEEELDQLYIDEKVLFSMTLSYNKVTEQIADTFFPKGSNTFIIEEGTTEFVDYVAMPFNADNKSAPLVFMNEIISGEIQGDIYNYRNIEKLPIVNFKNMPSSQKSHLDNINVKFTSLDYEEILTYNKPEVKSELVEIIYELWRENIE